jgi:hypothetical protein
VLRATPARGHPTELRGIDRLTAME